MVFDHSVFVVKIRVDRKHGNFVLQSLPSSEASELKADLKVVDVPKGDVLFEPDCRAEFTYFPLDCVVSFLGDTGEGGTVEAWSVRNDAVAGMTGFVRAPTPLRG